MRESERGRERGNTHRYYFLNQQLVPLATPFPRTSSRSLSPTISLSSHSLSLSLSLPLSRQKCLSLLLSLLLPRSGCVFSIFVFDRRQPILSLRAQLSSALPLHSVFRSRCRASFRFLHHSEFFRSVVTLDAAEVQSSSNFVSKNRLVFPVFRFRDRVASVFSEIVLSFPKATTSPLPLLLPVCPCLLQI